MFKFSNFDEINQISFLITLKNQIILIKFRFTICKKLFI